MKKEDVDKILDKIVGDIDTLQKAGGDVRYQLCIMCDVHGSKPMSYSVFIKLWDGDGKPIAQRKISEKDGDLGWRDL